MTTTEKEDEDKTDFWKKFKQSSLGSALHIGGIRRAVETLFYLALYMGEE